MKRQFLALVIAVCALTAGGAARAAQSSIYEPYCFTTVAGLALNSGSTDNTGSLARFNEPWGVAVDGVGTVYVADTGNHTIRKITSGGGVSLLAGVPGSTGSANGANAVATFNRPTGVAVNSAGTVVYVADYNNHLIRQISGGSVSTLAGSGSIGATDATGTAAQFRNPFGVALNSAGTLLYVSDQNNQTIRVITVPGGVVTTVAGQAGVSGNTDDPANSLNARFNAPRGIAVDGSGNVYVADAGNFTVRKIAFSGGVSTLAGQVFTSGFNDGPGNGALFSFVHPVSPYGGPCGVAVDSFGIVYVTDQGNHTIRKITPGDSANNSVTTLAGAVGLPGSDDGTGMAAGFYDPAGVAVGAGRLYVADTLNHTVRAQCLCEPASWPSKPSHYAGLTITGTIGCQYAVEYTPNMGNNPTWNPLDTVTLPSSPYLYVDTNVLFSANRFYQAVTTGTGCAPAFLTINQYAGFLVQGSEGCQYRVEYTTNLGNPTWIPLYTFTMTSSPFLYVDTTVLFSANRFYRVVSVP